MGRGATRTSSAVGDYFLDDGNVLAEADDLPLPSEGGTPPHKNWVKISPIGWMKINCYVAGASW